MIVNFMEWVMKISFFFYFAHAWFIIYDQFPFYNIFPLCPRVCLVICKWHAGVKREMLGKENSWIVLIHRTSCSLRVALPGFTFSFLHTSRSVCYVISSFLYSYYLTRDTIFLVRSWYQKKKLFLFFHYFGKLFLSIIFTQKLSLSSSSSSIIDNVHMDWFQWH